MNKSSWYVNAQTYWNNVTPTVDGMLGGFSQINPIDTQGSLDFIKEFQLQGHACDCGAGIGRVTKHFLLKVPFQQVDLVEQSPVFVKEATQSYLKQEIVSGQVGQVLCMGLQDFVPKENTYDLIWCQWVLGHLTDDHFVSFFQRCIKGLKPNGLIGVKENNSKKTPIIDDEDSSVTRPDHVLRALFKKAGLEIIKEDIQRDLPEGLFVVRMYMLKPIK
ncbi:alpha-N-methyltransferase NTM1 [Pilobolus umbonatus]|nr:alpha-N-methyltransferase NTM1 [Pilobolus umbonatus]